MSLPTAKFQRFALVSIVESQETHSEGSPHIFTVLGTFSTEEEAKEHVKLCTEEDNRFNIYMTELGKWVPVPPKQEFIEKVMYQDKYVQDLMDGYFTSQKEAKAQFEEHQKELLDKGMPLLPAPDVVIDEGVLRSKLQLISDKFDIPLEELQETLQSKDTLTIAK